MFTRAQALRLALRTIEVAGHDSGEDSGPVAVAVIIKADGANTPAVSLAMDGVKLASVGVAVNKAATVIAYDMNTYGLSDYDATDVAIALGTFPQFCSWDGGIKLYTQDGVFVGSLGVSGRSAKGDRVLAARAAHAEGFQTDFGIDGLADDERENP